MRILNQEKKKSKTKKAKGTGGRIIRKTKRKNFKVQEYILGKKKTKGCETLRRKYKNVKQSKQREELEATGIHI